MVRASEPLEWGNRFGDHAYAFEELVAENGSAFLGSGTGISFENMRHPEYVNSWLQILSKDTRAIFTAAVKAQVAADFVLDEAHLAAKSNVQPPVAAYEQGITHYCLSWR